MEGSVVTTSAPTSGVGPEAGAGPVRGRRPAWGRVADAPFAWSLAVCVALALLSGAVLPTVPSYDPWSWIVWGREVSDPHLSFVVNGGPSWKPLPVMFTTVYGFFGGAAPWLWVVTERAFALMAFPAAYRLASRLVSRVGPHRAAPVAGVIAAFALVLTQDWAYFFYRGASEPILLSCALWALDRAFAGRRWQAFALGVALGLMRPEVWPLMIVYGGWLAYRDRRWSARFGVLAGLMAMPLLWFAPPGISTGQPLLAANHAADYNGHLGSSPFITVLRRGVDDASVPVLILALIAVGITLYRERDRLILWTAGLASAWWVVVVGETLDGYPGLERFYLPAAALTCVLAGVGVVRIGLLVSELVGGPGRVSGGLDGVGQLRRRVAAWCGLGAAVAAVAVAYVFVADRVSYTRGENAVASRAATRLNQLSAAVAAVGGHAGVYPCRSSYAAINHSVQTALAWKLRVTLERVGTTMSHQGVLFVGPHDSIDGAPAPINPRLNRKILIKQVGPYTMYRVYRDGHLNRCVGG